MSSGSTEVQDVVAAAPTAMLIGDDWSAGGGETLAVVDPSTEEVVAEVAAATVQDAREAVRAAADAGPVWATTAPRQRAEVLRRAFELMTSRADWLARLIAIENGKTLADARAEVHYAAEFFRWYAEEAVRLDGLIRRAPAGGNNILVLHQPIGVCLLITPWNFPAAMATRKLGPALAAGCTVVVKPASETPLTALAIGALLIEAGAPAGVVNVVPSRRAAPLASALLADPRVRKLSFTGSTEVGRSLLAEAAKNVVSTSMELGGNAPFIVLADADLDAAVAGALVAKMRNGGQACTAANRFYVHESIADEFGHRLARGMSAMRMGPGLTPGVEVGPLINAKARETVAGLVDGAVEAGAEIITGDRPAENRGYFYAPTVLTHVRSDAPILSEEIFGPVAPIVAFGSPAEAVELANASELGLAAYVYTTDLAAGLRVSERIQAGMVGLNRAIVSDPAAPFGGVRQSGLGREGGHEGLLAFTESKYIAVEW